MTDERLAVIRAAMEADLHSLDGRELLAEVDRLREQLAMQAQSPAPDPSPVWQELDRWLRCRGGRRIAWNIGFGEYHIELLGYERRVVAREHKKGQVASDIARLALDEWARLYGKDW